MGVNLCFTSWSANCRGCSLSAKKLFPCQGASDFLTHWWSISSLHTAKTLVYNEAVSELDHSKTTAKRGWVLHAAVNGISLLVIVIYWITSAMLFPVSLAKKLIISNNIFTFCLSDSNPVTWFQHRQFLLPAVCLQLMAAQIEMSA